ncbi:MAG: c-type cytochrome [Verrucomicrobia bacterium]|jgi:cytochrome c|nr:c-type cytochrome [Verrucomicrobiota bacterium]
MARRNYRLFLKILLVTVVLPIGYSALIFGAWLYGRLAGPPGSPSTSGADAAYYASMTESAQAEAEQARLEESLIPPGAALAKDFNCTACHKEDTKLVGPSFIQVAEHYAAEADTARGRLVQKIKDGGKGNWGDIPMPPHPQYSEEKLGEIVDYILSLAPEKPDTVPDGSEG